MAFYNYKTRKFNTPVQKRGRCVLDINGVPLVSIMCDMSESDKERAINSMIALAGIYQSHDYDYLFPANRVQIDIDPKKYTCDEIFDDLIKQAAKWIQSPRNKIFESFIHRHNFLLKHSCGVLRSQGEDVSADIMWNDYSIIRVNSTRAPIMRQLNPDLFES